MNEIENINIQKFLTIIEECNLHCKRIFHASVKMKNYMPLDREKYYSLSEEEIEHIDQLIFRFTKLQDTVGGKLFPLVLIIIGEQVNDKSFIDILNRLEQLRIVESADKWMKIREIRNYIAHEYALILDERIDAINNIFIQWTKILYEIYKHTKLYVESKVDYEVSEVNRTIYEVPSFPVELI